MIEKIILNINHSDDYTDYLFMTAGLTNRHIIPLVNPKPGDIKRQSDACTKVVRCYASSRALTDEDHPVSIDTEGNSIRVLTRSYLKEDGSVNPAVAETVRHAVQERLLDVLLSQENLREVFRHYFPLFWGRRKRIYSDPRLFFSPSGRSGGLLFPWDDFPLGAVLKAMEEDPKNFRLRLGGGCSCGEKPILIDYEDVYRKTWNLYTWCPVCGAHRTIRAWNFQRADRCDDAIMNAEVEYGIKGHTLSNLSLFDVIDTLRSA